jgi:hypothetical protein
MVSFFKHIFHSYLIDFFIRALDAHKNKSFYSYKYVD